jgi:non-canonical purine NTP pyrophosphatase (RdgB/HAM1 family)
VAHFSRGDCPARIFAVARHPAGNVIGEANLNARKLLIATNNPGKVREITAILATIPLELVQPKHLGIELNVDEAGATFYENARFKALAFARAANLPAIADDSGLEVAVLDGWPGIHSVRWAGPNAQDGDRRRLLLARLAGRSAADRAARFVCSVVLARPDRVIGDATGVLPGRIAEDERGDGGFGYDPIFVPDGFDQTVAELPGELKNTFSHRYKALRQLWPLLEALSVEP